MGDRHAALAVSQAKLDIAGPGELRQVEGVSGADGCRPHLVGRADEEDGARTELLVSDGESGTGDGGELAPSLTVRGAGQEEEEQ